MVGCYVLITEMKVAELAAFTTENMLSLEELLDQARKKKLPAECSCCGEMLEDCVNRYQEVPSSDATIKFEVVDQVSACVQYSSGGGDCRKMKDGLRIIVRDHLARRLRRAGAPCTVHKF